MARRPESNPAGPELRRRRLAAGWGQREIARKLGCAQSRVSYMEVGSVSKAEAYAAYAALLDEIERNKT